MKLNSILVAGMLMAGGAFAGEPTLPDQASDQAAAALANRDASSAPDDRPAATAPTLPEQASDRAREALAEIAFGKRGEEARAEHAAQDRAAQRAAEARAAATTRATEARTAAATRATEARSSAGAARVTLPAPATRPGR